MKKKNEKQISPSQLENFKLMFFTMKNLQKELAKKPKKS
jgi:hypothetical protein